jgi:hypothetical protein
MNAPAYFVLFVRLLGVFFLGSSIPGMLSGVGQAIWAVAGLVNPNSAHPEPLAELAGVAIGAAVIGIQVWLGWYLLCRGERLIRYVVRNARERCPQCQYSLKGLTGRTCPECGGPVEPQPEAPTGG